jgi:hypothetical protein
LDSRRGDGDELGGEASAANVELGRPRWSGSEGDSELTPKSGSAQDEGNRLPMLS